MNAAANTMESRENMILKMFRKFNAAIVRFIMGIRFRAIGATLLASFAGLSLTTNIIPSAMEFTGIMDSFSARWDLGGFAVYSMMAWACWRLGGAENRRQKTRRHYSWLRRSGHRPALYRRRHRHGHEHSPDRRRRGPALWRHRRHDYR